MACQNINAYQNHQDACDKFMEQSAKSMQLNTYVDGSEAYVTSMARKDADVYLGKDVEDTVGGIGYTYRVYRNKSVDFKLPNFGMCDKITAHASSTSGSLGFSWKFPGL